MIACTYTISKEIKTEPAHGIQSKKIMVCDLAHKPKPCPELKTILQP